MLYIRTDGNHRIGAGHLMRCLSIADAAVSLGMQVLFLLADADSEGLVRSRGYDCHILHTDYQRPEEELRQIETVLCRDERALVLIDSYFVNNEYLKAIKKWVRTAYLDDFGKESLEADLIINYNIYAPKLPCRKMYGEKSTELLLGSAYAPLRKEFGETPYMVREEAEHVLITTGGADCYNVAGQLALRLAEWSDQESGRETGRKPGTQTGGSGAGTGRLQIHIVSGPFHDFRDQLKQLQARYPGITIHENVTNMSELMAACDIAVSAAGSTLYELCAIGVPTVYFYFVENQELPARYFSQMTKMHNAGNYAADAQNTLNGLTRETIRMLESKQLRLTVSESMREVADGRGAQRIAQALLRMERRKG